MNISFLACTHKTSLLSPINGLVTNKPNGLFKRLFLLISNTSINEEVEVEIKFEKEKPDAATTIQLNAFTKICNYNLDDFKPYLKEHSKKTVLKSLIEKIAYNTQLLLVLSSKKTFFSNGCKLTVSFLNDSYSFDLVEKGHKFPSQSTKENESTHNPYTKRMPFNTYNFTPSDDILKVLKHVQSSSRTAKKRQKVIQITNKIQKKGHSPDKIINLEDYDSEEIDNSKLTELAESYNENLRSPSDKSCLLSCTTYSYNEVLDDPELSKSILFK